VRRLAFCRDRAVFDAHQQPDQPFLRRHDADDLFQVGIEPHHFRGEVKHDSSLIAGTCAADDLAIHLRNRADKVCQYHRGDQARFAVLACNGQVRAPGACRVVVDRADEPLLKLRKLHRLACVLSLGYPAIAMDETDYLIAFRHIAHPVCLGLGLPW
jgi:hypothetical protein